MLEQLKERVCKANKLLPRNNLSLFSWGSVSGIDREQGLMVIKPAGASFEKLVPKSMSVVDMSGKLVEGSPPSVDTLIHLELYRSFPTIGGVTHTHSKWATIMSQIGLDIPVYGAVHAEYFYGDIPCTKPLTNDQIHKDYARETGLAVVRALYEKKLTPERVGACLVASHGPFTWGATELVAVQNAIVLEEVSMSAWHTMQMPIKIGKIPQTMLDEHFFTRNSKQQPSGQIPNVV
ncbi:MAG: L-ribulose-5-phosphate 4-epimerase AraD [Oscillospiraceae bacterium]|jgi:L-ribulose-5-phosphate 4-epimerase|nr:L-ribulose-5-phosphate 4-epimerase AraD [Oscillospiraceae bacterium]